MKFTEAWSQMAKQNITLKVTVLCLAACVLFLGFSVVKLSLADPLLIERSCYSTSTSLASAEPTIEEMKTFIRLSLEQRFNTREKPIEGYLSKEELIQRKTEQEALQEKEITQSVLVGEITIKDSQIIVQMDRYYSVKYVRSGVPVTLTVKLESKSRTSTNPYGLILSSIQELKPKAKEEN